MGIGQEEFYRRCQDFVQRMMEYEPVLATGMGEHRHDHRLADYSRSALEGWKRELAAATAWICFQLTPASFRAASTAVRHRLPTDLVPTMLSPVFPKRCIPTPITATSCILSSPNRVYICLNFQELKAVSSS